MATRIEKGNNGLEKVVIETAYGVAEVYRLGACITRYAVKLGGEREVIFLSKTSKFEVGKAIRGGVPVCWPWFGPHPTDAKLPQHGLVRAVEWSVTEMEEGRVVLETRSSAETAKTFAGEYVLKMVVMVGSDGLKFWLETTNTGKAAFTVGEAVHTYFNIGDIKATTTTGFEGLSYVDKVDGGKVKTETAARVGVTGETDRVYIGAKGPHLIESPAGKIKVSKTGSSDTVYWNPWEKKAEGLPDLAGGQWPGFVCVEAVNTGANAVVVKPGETHVIACQIEAL